jgi:ribosomal protein S14
MQLNNGIRIMLKTRSITCAFCGADAEQTSGTKLITSSNTLYGSSELGYFSKIRCHACGESQGVVRHFCLGLGVAMRDCARAWNKWGNITNYERTRKLNPADGRVLYMRFYESDYRRP